MILFGDGFDLYASISQAAGRWSTGGDQSILTSGGRNGAGAMRNSAHTSNTQARATLASAISTIFVQFGMKIDGYSNVQATGIVALVNSGGSAILTVTIDKDTHLLSIREGGRSGTIRATATTAIGTGTWYHIAMKIVIHATTGSIDFRINGTTEPSVVTGVDTEGATGGAKHVDWVPDGFGSPYNLDIDDVIIYDDTDTINNTFLGDCTFGRYMPDADTAQKDFTPDTGSTNYTQVDEVNADGDTSYVESNTVGHKDRYGITPGLTTGSIKAVLVSTVAKGGGDLKHLIKTGSTEAASAAAIATDATNYKSQSTVFQRDPDTGVAWTRSGLDAAEIGVEVA